MRSTERLDGSGSTAEGLSDLAFRQVIEVAKNHRGPLAWCEHLQRVANGDRRRIEHLRFAIWHTAPPLENHEARIVRPVEIVERRLVAHRLG